MAKDKSGGPVVGGEAALVSAGPGPELFVPLAPNADEHLALPTAIYHGGMDDAGQPLAFIPGVPARDLSRAEWDALTEDLRQMCLTTKLYDVAGPAPAEG